LHRLEQRRLHLGGARLISSARTRFAKQWAFFRIEFLRFLVEHHRADHVGRQQVWRELDARELDAQALATVFTASVFARPGTPSSRT